MVTGNFATSLTTRGLRADLETRCRPGGLPHYFRSSYHGGLGVPRLVNLFG